VRKYDLGEVKNGTMGQVKTEVHLRKFDLGEDKKNRM